MKKGILIKMNKETEKIEIDYEKIEGFDSSEELQSIYKLLDVRMIDVVDKGDYSIYLDDEGLLKDDTRLTLVIPERNVQLFGNVLILGGVDEEGNTKGLCIDEVNEILSDMDIQYIEDFGHEIAVW